MKNQLVVSVVILIFSGELTAQSIDELLIPNQEVTESAKSGAKQVLLELKDSLDLSSKEVRIRNFKLTTCNQPTWIDAKYGKLAVDFVGTRDSCYFYQHRTNYKGSYYTIDFIFDLDGRLLNKKVEWFMAVY